MAMRRKRRVTVKSNTAYQYESHDQIAVWMLRILIDLNTWKAARIEHDTGVLRAIGLTDEDCDKLNKAELFKLLVRTRKQYEERSIALSKITQANLHWLQKLVGLSDVDMVILLFSIFISTYKPLDSVASELGSLTKSSAVKMLSVTLDIPRQDINDSLSSKGNLLNSGLLKLSKTGFGDLESILDIPDGLSDILSASENERLDLLDHFFYQAKASSLKLKDFPHVEKDIVLIKRYLAGVIKNKSSGVNLLIYGEPGTGKTELVTTLAKSLKTTLYQISIVDIDGDDLPGEGRVRAYKMAQRILEKQGDALLVFDEIEDIFPKNSFFSHSKGPGKAWFNSLLETNSVPTFWLSNNIEQIDNAYIRRFDYVLELKAPPKSVRKKILKHSMAELNVSPEWIDMMSQDKQLVPGVISRAVKVVSSLPHADQYSIQGNMEQILANTLRAMGKSVDKQNQLPQLDYQLDALNPSHDIQQLLEGLQSVPGARLCMYGPPGTGKTAFGHYISSTLDKPLMVKRASDILSPYVGVAEKNIASMFEDAKEDSAILLLDEADSFLQERTMLKHSWEVTQVNELLTQMEAFDGLFVCSTNLMDKLDAAVLRRFDFKIKLDYLKADQAWLLFCRSLGWNKKQIVKNKHWLESLSTYTNLTPGDFANVHRQHRLSTDPLSAAILMRGLQQESLFKKDSNQQRGIGFHVAH